MPTLKKEFFSKGVRMNHRFGEQTNGNDPFGSGTFDLQAPKGMKATHAGHIGRAGIKTHGVERYYDPVSPIAKPGGGNASFSGPSQPPDYAAEVPARPPVSTARRKVTAGAK